jgi:hypothetical protein
VLRISDVYPESRFLSIPDPTTATEEKAKNVCCHTFCTCKYHKIALKNMGLGSEIREKPTVCRIPDPDPQHCLLKLILNSFQRKQIVNAHPLLL